jgi:flagellar hook-associated protein 2
MSGISTSSALFAGNSRYANDFKSVIDRAVAIASLPMNQLKAQKTALQDQSAGLTTLDMKLAALQTAVGGIGVAASSSSWAATVSDSTVLTAAASAGALPGSYSVEVTDLGSYNNTMSLDGLEAVRDPALDNITGHTNFTLSANGRSFSFTAGTLNEMAAKINGSGLDVQASLVNVGPEGAPDYRLSIQGTKLGSLAISLKDDAEPANELLSTLAPGARAAYKVNGFATPATSESRTVEIAPGVKISLLSKSEAGKAATITVSRTMDPIANALLSFVNAYNAAVDEVDKSRGASAGALAGQGIVYTVGKALSAVAGFAPGSGPFSSLEDLGVSLGQDGKLLLDRSKFDSAVAGKTAGLLDFLGSASGGGFLRSATDVLKGLEDPETGSVRAAMKSLDSQIDGQDGQIARQQESIDDLQMRLNAQMAAADALIASLEQQATYMTNLFQAMIASAETSR